MGDFKLNLPPGFQFHPTDEELIVHFLYRKASLLPCYPDVIPDLGLCPYDPWELDGKALAGGNQWYFYSRRTPNRVSANGYWEKLGEDEPVTSSGNKVGVKRFLQFYVGEAPAGIGTRWIMQEYSLSDYSSTTKSSKRRGQPKTESRKWVLCRVYCEASMETQGGFNDDDGTELSCLDEVFLALDDDLEETSFPN